MERRQHADDDDTDSLPDLRPIHDHNPWRDASDPEEDDIDGLNWENRPRDRSRTLEGLDMPDGNPLMHNFATMLHGIAGRPMTPRANQENPAGGTRQGTRITRHGPHMEIRREGPNSSFIFSSSYSSGPSTFGGGGPRDPHDPMTGIHKSVAIANHISSISTPLIRVTSA